MFEIKKRGFSLGFKLSLSITLLIILLMTAVSINTYIRNRNAFLTEAEKRGWLTARTVSAFAADYLRGNRTYLLSNIMDHLERDPFIKQAAVVDVNGNVVVSTNPQLLKAPFSHPLLQSAMSEKKDRMLYKTDYRGHPLAFLFASPIAPRQQEPVGYFWLEADLSYISNYLLALAYQQIFTSLLAIIAGLIISRLIIIRLVQKPVHELLQATDRMAVGDFSGQVSVLHHDELGRLATAFNTMSGHISVLFQSIRDSIKNISQTTLTIMSISDQSENALLQEVNANSRKLLRHTDKLNTICQQFKFNE
ncbi:methyl-accepting chemotaxis protein [Desulfurispora thermophila]|uniref:methyl-accepting chemotaxis protein n=1 Tax=Desulfurispora thermophila TaxID=265470 RepID=UPI000374B2C1|nr:HAMP domain-containing protein [Desulfurispora thermophila]